MCSYVAIAFDTFPTESASPVQYSTEKGISRTPSDNVFSKTS